MDIERIIESMALCGDPDALVLQSDDIDYSINDVIIEITNRTEFGKLMADSWRIILEMRVPDGCLAVWNEKPLQVICLQGSIVKPV